MAHDSDILKHHQPADGLTVVLILDREHADVPPRVYRPGYSLEPRPWEIARRALIGEEVTKEELCAMTP